MGGARWLSTPTGGPVSGTNSFSRDPGMTVLPEAIESVRENPVQSVAPVVAES